MQIGFNFTVGDTLALTQRLIHEQQIDYCELLIDNFLHVPPQELKDAFACPLGFHIMFSKFLENDAASLSLMAERLQEYIAVLQPLYVSDHIACFSHRGRQLHHLAELDYTRNYDRVCRRVIEWQAQLGQRLYLENYPSMMDGGCAAPDFFERLIDDSGAGILFDVSNAICASRNCGMPPTAWRKLMASTRHFHVGGYSRSILAPHLALDTHDTALADDTLSFIAQHRAMFCRPGTTITYERDANLGYDDIVADLNALRAALDNSTDIYADKCDAGV
jgi:methanobactin biosynthesis cassette protein MbnB